MSKLLLVVRNILLDSVNELTCWFNFIFHVLLFNINHTIIVSFLAQLLETRIEFAILFVENASLVP